MPEKLPQGWIRTNLGEVCVLNPRTNLGSLPPDHTEVSFVPMAAVEEESGRLNASQIRQLGAVRKGYTPFKENDVIFAKITPCMENGKIALATGLKNGLGYGSTEFIVFRCYEGLLPRFLLYFLLQPSLRQAAEYQMNGAVGQKRVPTSFLFNYELLLPPAHEQKRIVAKLDAAFAKLERAENAVGRAKQRLKQYRSIVLDAAIRGELTKEWRRKNPGATTVNQLPDVGSPPHWNIPQTWSWLLSSKTFSFVTSGSRSWSRYYSEDGDLFIRVGNLNRESIALDLDSIQRVKPPPDSEGLRTRLIAGDILISITADVGMVAVVEEGLGTAYISQHIALARPIGNMDTKYLAYFLSAKRGGQAQLLSHVHGATKAGLGLNDIRNIWITHPPLTEQREIINNVERRLSAADQLTITLEQKLLSTRVTRQSLLSDAFVGRLVAQDPNDKPASILVKQIQLLKMAIKKEPKGGRMLRPRSKMQRKSLLTVLREHDEPISPEQLFREAGFIPAQVDLFYRELTELRDKLREQKPEDSITHLWPYHASVFLQLKEWIKK